MTLKTLDAYPAKVLVKVRSSGSASQQLILA